MHIFFKITYTIFALRERRKACIVLLLEEKREAGRGNLGRMRDFAIRKKRWPAEKTEAV